MRALHVLSFWTFFPRHNLEDDFFTFVQRLEAFPHDRRVVDKDILPAVLGNEAKPLFIVPPFDFAFSHKRLLNPLRALLKAPSTRAIPHCCATTSGTPHASNSAHIL